MKRELRDKCEKALVCIINWPKSMPSDRIRAIEGLMQLDGVKKSPASACTIMTEAINIIFDGPPSHESGRFVEVELDDGRSINVGEWIDKGDGLWALRITELPQQEVVR